MRSINFNKNINSGTDECVWMKAGVVKQKICAKGFNCTECTYDTALRKVAHENKRLEKAGKHLKGKRKNIVFNWKL